MIQDSVVQHADEQSALRGADEQIARATAHDNWLAVAFHVEGDQLKVQYTTNAFPRHLLLRAVDQLRVMLEREAQLPEPVFQEPLRIAERFRSQIVNKDVNSDRSHAESEGAG